ncbi:hypothetical protein AOQ84DRAFT_370585 [Glonium stellatum]|uniref:Uncharacterized protein n=1 Tax=Glonium stellatum TaxID=574774 RepID=A0A8E2FDM7_9PEZI|nr:hypothetical protein AOQ84DRAFT_370585 [Glonium stellatum]
MKHSDAIISDSWTRHLMIYANLAERSTSKSYAAILKQVPDYLYARVSHTRRSSTRDCPPFRGVNEFAVVAKLQLFLSEQFSGPEGPRPPPSVLSLFGFALHYTLEYWGTLTLKPSSGEDNMAVYIVGRRPDIAVAVCHKLFHEYLNFCNDDPARMTDSVLLEVLLKLKANPNYKFPYIHHLGRSSFEGRRRFESRWRMPLHIAIEGQSKRCVEVLLKNGADVNHVNSNGYTPLDDTLSAIYTTANRLGGGVPSGKLGGGRASSFNGFILRRVIRAQLASLFTIASLLLDAGAKAGQPVLTNGSMSKNPSHHQLTAQDLDKAQAYGISVDFRVLDPPRIVPSWYGFVLNRIPTFFGAGKSP